MGVEVAMLTGDSEDVARAVAEDHGIDTYFAEVLQRTRTRNSSSSKNGGRKWRWSGTA